MKYLLSAIALLFLASAPSANAHEGHAHAPGTVAPHGGIVKEGKSMHVELVVEGTTVKLFPLDKKYQSIPLKDVILTATAQPAKKTLVPLKLSPAKDGASFDGQIDPQGARRVELKVQVDISGKKDSFSFQVEPEG